MVLNGDEVKRRSAGADWLRAESYITNHVVSLESDESWRINGRTDVIPLGMKYLHGRLIIR
jgi:hypothetical protein